jgi:hypothetical protein
MDTMAVAVVGQVQTGYLLVAHLLVVKGMTVV